MCEQGLRNSASEREQQTRGGIVMFVRVANTERTETFPALGAVTACVIARGLVCKRAVALVGRSLAGLIHQRVFFIQYKSMRLYQRLQARGLSLG